MAMLDLAHLDREVQNIEREMVERGVSRATAAKCSAFRSALNVLTATRERQDRSNA